MFETASSPHSSAWLSFADARATSPTKIDGPAVTTPPRQNREISTPEEGKRGLSAMRRTARFVLSTSKFRATSGGTEGLNVTSAARTSAATSEPENRADKHHRQDDAQHGTGIDHRVDKPSAQHRVRLRRNLLESRARRAREGQQDHRSGNRFVG